MTDDRTPGQQRYADYLETRHWKATRDAKLEAAGYLCQRCGEGGKRRVYNGQTYWLGLHVHHLTYDRVGKEQMDDLEVLCIHCHQVEHGQTRLSAEEHRIRIRRSFAVSPREFIPEDEIAAEIAAWDHLVRKAGL